MSSPDNKIQTVTLKDNKKLELERLGSGATCICYKIIGSAEYEGQVIKLFNPVDRRGRPLNPESEQYKELKTRFFGMINPVFAIKRYYIQNELTNLITYERIELNDGNIAFRGKLAVSGETLKNHWAAQDNLTFYEQLRDLFLCIQSALQDLKTYHQNSYEAYKYGILNADFKPSNLWFAFIDGKENYIINNLDFGSCVNIAEVLDKLYEIKDYTDEKEIKTTVRKIKNMFSSTPNYYAVESCDSDVNRVLEKCRLILCTIDDKDKAYLKAARYIKLLDLKAVLTVFFERLWEIVGVSNDSSNKYERLWEKLLNAGDVLRYEKTFGDGDGNLLVRYNFVQTLVNLEDIKNNLCRFVFISEQFEEEINTLTAEKLHEKISSLHNCILKKDKFNQNLHNLNRNEFSDLCVGDILASKAFGQPIGDLLEALLYED